MSSSPSLLCILNLRKENRETEEKKKALEGYRMGHVE